MPAVCSVSACWKTWAEVAARFVVDPPTQTAGWKYALNIDGAGCSNRMAEQLKQACVPRSMCDAVIMP